MVDGDGGAGAGGESGPDGGQEGQGQGQEGSQVWQQEFHHKVQVRGQQGVLQPQWR